MKKYFLLPAILFTTIAGFAQTPPSYNSAEILLGLKKLKVIGSVLYVAAHPDDENTRLLAYMSKERLYRTGYLSMTRGDGGQNLIGDEQGIELGLIRTQELLAARRIDGAEQFFTRAYDFGFSKSTDEALKMWDKEKILSDVVWVIRKFQPDVIITRFPPDNRAGHGHHSASAVLAQEAYIAAADPNRFPAQFVYGVKPWKAKRIMWNTFNFGGGTNTTSDNQMKIDVGVFNPLLGKSYGEIASESRSQHKSQGFGVPRQRGQQFEFFTPVNGDAATTDVMDGVITDWSRIEGGAVINTMIDKIVAEYSFTNPAASVKSLVQLYKAIEKINDGDWKIKKLNEVKSLIEACAGLWMDVTTSQEFAVMGDSIKINFNIISRTDVPVEVKRVRLDSSDILLIPDSLKLKYSFYNEALKKELEEQPYFVDTFLNKQLVLNQNVNFLRRIKVNRKETEPYWVSKPMGSGSFTVDNRQLIGKAENDPVYNAEFYLSVAGVDLVYSKPVMYKFTDAVKGELYQKLVVYPSALIKATNSLLLFKDTAAKKANFSFIPQANLKPKANVTINTSKQWKLKPDFGSFQFIKDKEYELPVMVKPEKFVPGVTSYVQPSYTSNISSYNRQRVRKIEYDHIPTITYFPDALTKVVMVDVKTVGKKIGYINGAGDFVPYCLQQLGYTVDLLREEDVNFDKLKQYDAIVTGVRAYNVHPWLSNAYDALMQYVKEGGVLLVQYNTSNQIGPVHSKISPYPFVISRNRVTEEDTKVSFLAPNHPVLNYPNKITEKDFEGWVQERSVYEADNMDSNYVSVLGMNDADEPQRKGSLIVADYGKGRFIYSAVVFFRELPAGVPGAYRLMANLLARPNTK
ncbi:MAG: PIG-L family deacetylase [Chitinophagaceae bacterium]|nr:PIG-L family deacetylase [Chitinophagaceae bacterium]